MFTTSNLSSNGDIKSYYLFWGPKPVTGLWFHLINIQSRADLFDFFFYWKTDYICKWRILKKKDWFLVIGLIKTLQLLCAVVRKSFLRIICLKFMKLIRTIKLILVKLYNNLFQEYFNKSNILFKLEVMEWLTNRHQTSLQHKGLYLPSKRN